MNKSIGKSLIEIKNSMTILMRQSTIYKPISVRAAKFFYLIADLHKLNNMYQFTHEWFLDFFKKLVKSFHWSIYESSNKHKERGMHKLRKKMTKELFNLVCQTLFEKDVLLFAFLMSYNELDSELKCDMKQVEFFIKCDKTNETEIIEEQIAKSKLISKGKITRKKTDEERDLKLEKAKTNRRKKIAPWINPR